MADNNPKKKIRISSIILNTIAILIFVFATYELIVKFTNNSIYLFGVRSDVVLSDSMSCVNEDPRVQSFLEGHNDQLQKGDLIYSTKVTDKTELNIYDIVIFANRDNNKQTIHRIVQIKDGSQYADGQPRYIIRADSANFGSHDGAYTKKEIHAKLKSRTPFVGYILNFLTSIFGIILEVGIIVIIVLYQFFDDKYFGKKKIHNVANNTEQLNQNITENIDKSKEEEQEKQASEVD